MSRNRQKIPYFTCRFAVAAGVVVLGLGGCSQFGASGPSPRSIVHAVGKPVGGVAIKVIDVDDATTRRIVAQSRLEQFSDVLGDAVPAGAVIGAGDVLDISIWEAPPATLFGSAVNISSAPGSTTSSSLARSSTLPEQMVDDAGRIVVPFVGPVRAGGRTPSQVAQEISVRLNGLAHRPQVIVRLVRNASANVTVVGDVNSSARVPLTPKGERLLDVLASVGGTKQAVSKMTIQITRGGRVVSQSLERVIEDPAQNVRLQSGDVITAIYQPFSFTAVGATGVNGEIAFEGTGLTLAQALGRVGGLRDDRANPRSVFIYRLEQPKLLDPTIAEQQPTTPDGRIPVIYRIDLASPAGFFIAQGFPIRNRDVLYVSNAPMVDLQKFTSLVSSLAITGLSISTTVP